MKRPILLSIALAASALAFAVPANAASCGVGCSYTENITDFLVDPGPAPNPAAVLSNTYNTGLLVSVDGMYRSPYENGVPPGSHGPGYGVDPYSSVQGPAGFATFNFAGGITGLSLLWGSPDTYNTISFYSGLNGTGSLLYSFTGALLIQTFGHDQVTITTLNAFQSVKLSSTENAFEFAGLRAAVPLPATVPMFLSGLGAMGLVLRRRKQKKALKALAAA